ncbi:MAG TPA: ATP-grasp domain-containing protein [Balneolaceae bacterium]|nr:ATP-grasp domain-containing protein [Balneolaceae bacterium]
MLGTDNILALPVIRTLGALLPDATIHTLSYDKDKSHNSEHSKYVSSRHYFKSTKSAEIIEELIDKIEETAADILLPIDERDVKLLSIYRYKLNSKVYLPPLPNVSILDKLIYKNHLADFLQKNDFPCPATYHLGRLDTATLDNYLTPYLLKPIRGSAGQNIREITSKKELEEALLTLNADDYILQEFVPGQNFSCSLLAENGNILAETIQLELESRNFSISTAIRFVENKAISEATRRIIKRANYNGLANLDFRVDERNGQPNLVDFNARFWSNISGSKIAGVDFVLLACLAAMSIPFEKPVSNGNTYLMGRSILNYYRKKMLRPIYRVDTHSTYTDLWERIDDPLPEMVRFLRSKTAHQKKSKPDGHNIFSHIKISE